MRFYLYFVRVVCFTFELPARSCASVLIVRCETEVPNLVISTLADSNDKLLGVVWGST